MKNKPMNRRPLLEESVATRFSALATVNWTHGKYPTWPIAATFHDDLEIQFIKQGQGSYYIDGRIYPFRANVVLTIRPRAAHSLIPRRMNFMSKCCLLCAPALFRRFPQSDRLAWPVLMRLSEQESAVLMLLLRRLEDERRARQPHWRTMLGHLYGELVCLLRRAGERRTATPPPHPVADKLQEYLDDHYRAKLSGAELARHFGFSADYLSRIFKAHTGMGLKHYLLWRRIIEARALLETRPHLTMIAVAEQVGFPNFGLFNRAFKLFTNISAAGYRQLAEHKAAGSIPKAENRTAITENHIVKCGPVYQNSHETYRKEE